MYVTPLPFSPVQFQYTPLRENEQLERKNKSMETTVFDLNICLIQYLDPHFMLSHTLIEQTNIICNKNKHRHDLKIRSTRLYKQSI